MHSMSIKPEEAARKIYSQDWYPKWLWSAQMYFPNIFDIKYLMKFCGNLHGGLNKLAESLEVKRLGPQHQVTLSGQWEIKTPHGYNTLQNIAYVHSSEAESSFTKGMRKGCLTILGSSGLAFL